MAAQKPLEAAFEEEVDEQRVHWRSCMAILDAAVGKMRVSDLLHGFSFSLLESMYACRCGHCCPLSSTSLP